MNSIKGSQIIINMTSLLVNEVNICNATFEDAYTGAVHIASSLFDKIPTKSPCIFVQYTLVLVCLAFTFSTNDSISSSVPDSEAPKIKIVLQINLNMINHIMYLKIFALLRLYDFLEDLVH